MQQNICLQAKCCCANRNEYGMGQDELQNLHQKQRKNTGSLVFITLLLFFAKSFT
jgi:hypothetical protein